MTDEFTKYVFSSFKLFLDQLWRLALTPTGFKLVNKKFPKWQLKDENSGTILEAEIESWAVPPEGAKGFLEQILESNLTGRVLGVKGASGEPESPVELQEKIEMIKNVNLTSEEKDTFDSQMWVRGKKDSDDYFSLQNPVSELFLTVESPTETWIADQGKIEIKSLKGVFSKPSGNRIVAPIFCLFG